VGCGVRVRFVLYKLRWREKGRGNYDKRRQSIKVLNSTRVVNIGFERGISRD
jgi:hypothetical protein